MATPFRPDISRKNEYWISKHRYYELKHFCLQYKEWKEELKELDYISSSDVFNVEAKDGMKGENVSNKAFKLSKIQSKITLVEETCMEVAPYIFEYLLMAITEEKTYENLRTVYSIPCSRQSFYGYYRQFFYILSQKLQSL